MCVLRMAQLKELRGVFNNKIDLIESNLERTLELPKK